MTCCRCDHDLAECTCADLEERFKKIAGSKFVILGEEYQERIRQHIERSKEQKVRQE